MDLFDFIPPPVRTSDWTPTAPPSLDGITDIFLNFETTGLRWWSEDKPLSIGLSLPDGRSFYLPWGHEGGGNLAEQQVKDWALRELRRKRITNTNTRFDVHMARVWGLDLEAQGNEVSDIGHYAALLDDHRKVFGIDHLTKDYFPNHPVTPRLDESRMRIYHAGEAAPRAIYNVEMARKLRDAMWPELDAQDLQRVRALEDKVIYPVVAMEDAGTLIDMERLEAWEKSSKRQLDGYLLQLAKEFGFQVNPNSNKDMIRVFEKLGLPLTRLEAKTGKEIGNASFTEAILKAIDHPSIHLIRRTAKLDDLRVRFLVKYCRVLDSNGLLRYALHQLRSQKDEHADAGEAGTVTGRFSSAKLDEETGLNIQQIIKASKQRLSFGYEENDDSHDDEIYLIRKLHIPAPGMQFLSADAMQIEYRLFANYANNPGINKAYEKDPYLSFHKETWERFKPYKPDQSYREAKDLNFAQIYGAATIKLAVMLGMISKEKGEELRRFKDYDNMALAPAKEVKKIYKQILPEVEPLQKRASHLARPYCSEWCKKNDKLHKAFEHQGFVRSLLGRRSRFPDGDRIHKALNSVIQPGAADVMKQKIVELHAERKYTGFFMRYPVHDEVDGDAPNVECATRVREVLNRQSFPSLRIPILWEVSLGPNWGSVKDIGRAA